MQSAGTRGPGTVVTSSRPASELGGPAPVTATAEVSDVRQTKPTSPATSPLGEVWSTQPPTSSAPLDGVVATDALVATALEPEVVARASPVPYGTVLGRFANPIPSGAPLVFEVIDQEGDWLKVTLPVRPNGLTAWIPARQATLSRNRYRIEVDVSDHHLVVQAAGEVVVDTAVGIGKGLTPTPLGSFYLIELLAPTNPAGPYGPYAFGLSGYSETLASYNGGEGVIGIHGTNEPASLGHDSSHGCIRVANDVISYMASFLPLGTPVVISP
jgi:lipoprotein-anchoring transpeptidase ErfK/SrfK